MDVHVLGVSLETRSESIQLRVVTKRIGTQASGNSDKRSFDLVDYCTKL
jgi:hypothetical protein